MPPGSRLAQRTSSSNSNANAVSPKPNVLTRSPPPSPRTEYKPRVGPKEPYPMPSSNPASQYTLLEKLGTGSFGTVYKGIHNDTKQIVAIKQIGASCLHLRFHSLLVSLNLEAQTSKTPTTTYPKSSRRSPTSRSATRNTSHATMAPSSSIISYGSSWSTLRGAPASIF